MDDEERRLIEGARLREAQGRATRLDRWRLQAAERQSVPVERGFTEAESAEWNEWLQQHRDREFEDRIKPAIDAVVEAAGEELAELHTKVRELALTVAELKGEIRGMRSAPHDTGLIGVDGTKLLRNGRDAH
jgi:hypothetical protein